MRTDRQTYIDGTYEAALAKGCDCFQLKYDGWWCRMVAEEGHYEMYNREGRQLRSGQLPGNFTGTLVGEYMFGTQWAQAPQRKDKFFLFDMWEGGTVDYSRFSYRDRYCLTRTVMPELPIWCQLIDIFPIDIFKETWQTCVENGDYEGVVFRRKKDSVDDRLIRTKRDFREDLQVTGFEVGEGKFAGTLGALQCRTRAGVLCSVGGGFSNELRDEIWNNQAKYLGRWFEASGKAKFQSGLLRHPNFEGWKDVTC